MTERTAYSSTVVSPAHLGAGIVLAAVVTCTVAVLGGPSWLTGACALLLTLTALYVSTVRLLVTRDVVVVGYGPRGWRPRVISTNRVIRAQPALLSWAQALGLDTALGRRVSRFTIRPGPALCLELVDGEQVRVSTPHPDAAVAQLDIH